MRINRLLIIGFIALLAGCGPQEAILNFAPPEKYSKFYWGEVTGKRNGVTMWNPRIGGALYPYNPPYQVCHDTTFSMSITEYTNSGCERLSLAFIRLPRRVGAVRNFEHRLGSDYCDKQLLPSVGLHILECDAMVGTYKTDSTRQSEVTIRSFDAGTGEVSGSLKLNFVVVQKPAPNVIADAPDRFYFEAEFSTKLWQKGQRSYL
jgi:hypothetical protein